MLAEKSVTIICISHLQFSRSSENARLNKRTSHMINPLCKIKKRSSRKKMLNYRKNLTSHVIGDNHAGALHVWYHTRIEHERPNNNDIRTQRYCRLFSCHGASYGVCPSMRRTFEKPANIYSFYNRIFYDHFLCFT